MPVTLPTGIKGYDIVMDRVGNPEGNYTVLAYQPIPAALSIQSQPNYTVAAVANFQPSASSILPVSCVLPISIYSLYSL